MLAMAGRKFAGEVPNPMMIQPGALVVPNGGMKGVRVPPVAYSVDD